MEDEGCACETRTNRQIPTQIWELYKTEYVS